MEKHSKRNKSKDNPYTLSYNETTSSYEIQKRRLKKYYFEDMTFDIDIYNL